MEVENNIPEGWIETTLGDIVDSANTGLDAIKRAPIVEEETGIKCFRIQDASQKKAFINWGNTKVEDRNFKKFQLIKGDILIARTGNSIGVHFLVKNNLKSVFNNGLIRLRVNEKADFEYLYKVIESNYFKRYVQSIAYGTSTQPNMQINALLGLELKLPPLPEQKAIAKVLTAFDDKIELLQAQNKTLETMAQTIFKEWFGKYQIGDDLPEGWRIEKLGDILETYLGGTPSKRKNEYWDNGSIPWINSGEVNNFIITEGTTLITKLGLEKSATKLLPKGTVVIAITGATLGQYSILEIESCFNQSVVGIVGNDKIKSSFIYFWIANNIHAIIRNATGGAQQHINKENVNSFEMIIPSDKLLNKFQCISEPIMNKITNNEFETKSLAKTRDILLPKLMSGQVRVNNIKQTTNA